MKATMKIMGKIGMEIIKMVVLWQAIIPWVSDIMEYDWLWNEQLTNGILVVMVSIAGYSCITSMKNYIKELKSMKEARKNNKKRGNAKKASPDSFFFRVEFMDIYGKIL